VNWQQKKLYIYLVVFFDKLFIQSIRFLILVELRQNKDRCREIYLIERSLKLKKKRIAFRPPIIVSSHEFLLNKIQNQFIKQKIFILYCWAIIIWLYEYIFWTINKSNRNNSFLIKNILNEIEERGGKCII
jgi:hypothetical protein